MLQQILMLPMIMSGFKPNPNIFVTQRTVGFVQLDAKGNPKTYCSGWAVRNNVVLTAAHCLANMDLSNVRVYLASNGSKSAQYKIIEAEINPYYKYRGLSFKNLEDLDDADIALVRLEKNILKEVITYQVADTEDLEGALGQPIYHLGVGYDNNKMMNGLEGAQLNLPAQDVTAPLIRSERDSEQMTCPGDSGGPVFIEMTAGEFALVGVTSVSVNDDRVKALKTGESIPCDYGKEVYTVPLYRFKNWFFDFISKK